MHRWLVRSLLVFALLAASLPVAARETKLLRFPDVYGNQVVFCYGGDIWKAPLSGGVAVRLTASPGIEVFPRFSPDGKWIAFTGQYDGDEQVYVMPSEGGIPKKLTYYPAEGPLAERWGFDNIVYGWTPDGKSVLFRSLRYGYAEHPGQLYTVSMEGGPAVQLPMPRAGAGDFSPDGKRIVYSPLWRDFRDWKRYQGGWAEDLYVYDLATAATTPVSPTKRTERDPMWIGNAIYFDSDRTGTMNLYKYDLATKQTTQLTHSDTWDVRWSTSDERTTIVYELGGILHAYDVTSGKDRAIDIDVPDDGLWERPDQVSAAHAIEDFDLAPHAERALFSARGDVFTAPIEHGPTRNLTRTPGVHDRAAAWSPDGKTIAFISDATGEEEIALVPQDGSAKLEMLTKGHAMRLYRPVWSPDSKSIAFSDKEGRIYVVTVATGKEVEVADERDFQVTDYAWSPDSRWLAFSLSQPISTNRALYIWGAEDGKTRKVTDGFFGEQNPSWGHDGKYLWYLSDREYQPQFSTIEWNFATNRMTGIFALALRKDVPDPFAPRSDEVKEPGAEKDEKADADKAKGEKGKGEKGKGAEKAPAPIKIDFDGLGRRVSRVPIEADNYGGLTAVKGHLIYVRFSARYYGRAPAAKPDIVLYDLDKRKETTLVEGSGSYAVSFDGKKLLARSGRQYVLHDVAPGSKEKKNVSTDGLVVDRVPRKEWHEIFEEVWRRYRDFFYAKNMNGYDWVALKNRYEPLVKYVAHRADLNYVIGEMIGELSNSHTYIVGGDWIHPKRKPVGLLGAKITWDPAAGHYRLSKIWAGENEEPRYRSPMSEIGVNVKEGDFLLAIDGDPLRPDQDPFALLVDRAKNPVTLTIAPKDDPKATRDVKVTPIRRESELIYLDWVNHNREYVDEKTDGKVGYIHVPDMGADGAREFIKWFYPQARKNGLIVDDRANGGGNISQWIIDRLSRKLLGIEYARTAEDPGTYPGRVMRGPMACLVSETSASDGDIFPHMFRSSHLGPLIGKRTWGGVIGISGHGPLIDGGTVYVPQYDNLSADGKHIVEGVGVSPDIEVANDPASEIAGKDNQLDRAIEEVMGQLAKDPHDLPPRPPDPDKTK